MSQKRIQELEQAIRHHSKLYYNAQAEITDAEFDALVDELREIDPGNSVLAEVGAAPTWGCKVTHPSLMGSLAKVHTTQEVEEWHAEIKPVWSPTLGAVKSALVGSPKLDGLAVRLRYDKGVLTEAATRGDGEIGQDVLDNMRYVSNVPTEITDECGSVVEFDGEIRGEIVMSKQAWKEFGTEFANPRNAAAGGLLQKDPKETGKRHLEFVAYWFRSDSVYGGGEMQFASCAENLGFQYVELEVVHDIEGYLEEWVEKRRDYPYQIDGVVFSANAIAEQEQAGWNGKRPRGKIAWKFPPQQEETVVTGVQWQVGRTGKLTPVVEIKPTLIDGSTVSKASLASVSLFEQLGLGRGDKVLMQKAGDIIPQLVRVVHKADTPRFDVPTQCSVCEATVDQEGAHLYCANPSCGAKSEGRILYWLRMLDVKGAGSSVVSAMCAHKLVGDLSDLYSLSPGVLGGVIGSAKNAEKIVNEIMAKREVPLWKFLAGLGVPHLGKTAAKTIAKKYGSMDSVMRATVDELMLLEGIGGLMATKIVSGLAYIREEIARLVDVVEVQNPVQGGSLAGKSFCLTGKMSRSRKDIATDIEAAGGEVKSGVSSGLDYLVQADPTSASSKTTKAEKYGVAVISEERLAEMM